ncbi:MAG TPA: MFS transporter [Longimicrobium sp.]|nr:MFS transporter [Longimicrobium sp.]
MSAGARAATAPGFRTFLLVWAGQLISGVGSGFTSFALGVWVYQKTGSVTGFALILVAATLPTILLLPVAGALVDRWDRRRTMLVSDTISASATLALALLLYADRLHIVHIYLAAMVYAACAAFQWPAYSAATTLLVPKHLLGRAAGMVEFAYAASGILAPLLAGILIGRIGIPGVMLIDCATLLAAVATLSVVRFPKPAAREEADARPSLWTEVRLGVRYVAERPGLTALMAFFSSINLFSNFNNVLIVPLVLSFATPAVLGTTLSTGAAGILLGGMVMSTWGGPRRRVRGIVVGAGILGMSMMVMGLRPWAPLVAAGLFLFNLCMPVVNGCSQTVWQVKVPPELQGRVFAIRRMIATCTAPVCYLVAGPLADRVFAPLLAPGGALAGRLGPLLGGTGPGRGIGLLFMVTGGMCVLVAATGLLSPRLMRMEDDLPDAVPDALPEAALEPRPALA